MYIDQLYTKVMENYGVNPKGFNISDLRELQRVAIKKSCLDAILSLNVTIDYLYAHVTFDNKSSQLQYEYVHKKYNELRCEYVHLLNEFNRIESSV
jgi:hypothetical protein